MPQGQHSNILKNSGLGVLFRDLNAGLRQQMFFWGRDVLHSEGNLLVEHGLVKSRSSGLQGTSCYGCEWCGGRIELHGACACWHQEHGDGFVYVRPQGRCFIWKGREAPVPGEWPEELLLAADPATLYSAALPFLEWWLDYERWIAGCQPGTYRQRCFQHYKAVPKARAWLPPESAVLWLERFMQDPHQTPRAKKM